MKKLICVLLLCCIPLCFPTAYAESLLPNFALKGTQSSEYQTFYLATLCAINITREGDFKENIEMTRAVCKQINVASKETISCNYIGDKFVVNVEINFDNKVFVIFSSAYIDTEKTLPFLKESLLAQQSSDYLPFLYNQNSFSISSEDLISLLQNISTKLAIIVVPSPYQSAAMEDVEIVLFDTYATSNEENVRNHIILYVE